MNEEIIGISSGKEPGPLKALKKIKDAFLFWLKCVVSNTEEEQKANSRGSTLPHC